MPLNINLGLVGGYVTAPGFLSGVPGGSWQGFNSNTDGILVRGVAIGQNVAGTAGGALDFAAVTISPNSGRTCMDVFGNVVGIPIPLPGLPSNLWTAGTYSDVPVWNSMSPMQGHLDPYSGLVTTSGTSVTLVSGGSFRTGTYWNGYPIFINGVSYPVSSVSSGSALTLTTTAGTQTSVPYYAPFSTASWGSGVYPIGQTACNAGPVVPSGAPYGINSSSYFSSLYGFAAFTHGSYNSIESYSDGTNPAGGVVAGQLLATTIYPAGTVTRTGTLTTPTALGGILYIYPADQDPAAGTILTVDNPMLPGYSTAYEGMLAVRSDLHCLRYYNSSTSTWSCISGVSSITGTANEVIASASTGAITLSLPQAIATTSSPTFAGLTAGTVQATAAGTAIAFQTGSPYNFQVNGNGVASLAQLNASLSTNTGAIVIEGGYGSGSTYTWPFQVSTAGNVVTNNLTVNGTCAGCMSGGGAVWAVSSPSLYPALTTYNLLLGESTNASGSKLDIAGSMNVSGTLQSTATGTNPAIQVNPGGLGTLSFEVYGSGEVALNGTSAVLAWSPQTTSASFPSLASWGGLAFQGGIGYWWWNANTAAWGVWSPQGPRIQTSYSSSTRPWGSVYQNTNKTTMHVTGSASFTSTGTGNCYTDSSSTPTTGVAAIGGNPSGYNSWTSFSFDVLPNNYYECLESGGGAVVFGYWTEWY
jgi:hypothetical protein